MDGLLMLMLVWSGGVSGRVAYVQWSLAEEWHPLRWCTWGIFNFQFIPTKHIRYLIFIC